MLADYCKKKDLEFSYELFDLEDMMHLPTLSHLIKDRACNIIMYSIFSLPEDDNLREQLLDTALKRGNIIHFVNEDLQLTDADDLKQIKKYLVFSKYGHSRAPIGLPLSETTKSYFKTWATSLGQLDGGGRGPSA